MDVPERDPGAADAPANRLQRRKMRTRNALIRSAQRFIAEGKLIVPILDITQAADVGMGSFYNHFSTKEELFAAAVADALDDMGAVLDGVTGSITDPAEAFAANYRLSGRLFRYRPREAALLLANGGSLILSDRGLSPRALRDITAAIDGGRFSITDPELGLAIAGGMFVGLATLLRERPERDTDATVDEVTERLLRTLGMSAQQARSICRRPLPDISELQDTPTAWPAE
jgi:AcrR family transcriptional regulator